MTEYGAMLGKTTWRATRELTIYIIASREHIIIHATSAHTICSMNTSL